MVGPKEALRSESLLHATGGPVESSAAVSGGTVFVGSDDDILYAYDAAGQTGCSGTPKVCQPLWTAPTGGDVVSSPAVAGRRALRRILILDVVGWFGADGA